MLSTSRTGAGTIRIVIGTIALMTISLASCAQPPEPPGVSPTPSASVTPSRSATPSPSVTPAAWRRIAPLPMDGLQIDSTVMADTEVFLFARKGLDREPYCRYVTFSYDVARDAWTPERGLFEYPYKTERGELLIQPGEMPTPGKSAAIASGERPPCA